MQEFKDFNKLYLSLMRVFDDNDLVMRLPVFMTSLAYFLSEMSERAVKYGINKDDFIDGLATATKNVNELKDRKKTSKAMDANKIDNGCKSQNDNEMQSTGFDINAKDLIERGKLVFSPYKTTDEKVEIEITDNAINIQAGNVSVKMPRHSTQDVNLINQQVTLKQEPYKEVVRKLYTKECDLDASQNSQQRRKDGKLDNINDY